MFYSSEIIVNMISKYNELLENYFSEVRIKRFDEHILNDIGTWSSGKRLSPLYYGILKRVFSRFNESCKKIDFITYDHVIDFLRSEKKRVSFKTFYAHIQAFKKLLFGQPSMQKLASDDLELFKKIFEVALKKHGFVDYELLKEKSPEEPAVPLSREQIKRILTHSSRRTSLIFEFLLRSGARVNQVVKIKRQDVIPHSNEHDIQLVEIPVQKSFTRTVVMPDNFMRNFLYEFNEDNDFLFHPTTSLSSAHHKEQISDRDSEPMKRSYVYREIKRCSDMVDEFDTDDNPIKPDNILASFIKILSDNGFDENVICDYLEKGVAAFNSIKAAESILKCFKFINHINNKIWQRKELPKE